MRSMVAMATGFLEQMNVVPRTTINTNGEQRINSEV